MKRRDYFLLAFLGGVVVLVVAAFQAGPGYFDADYYRATGEELARGEGFFEPFLWNYLDDPAGLPHPSHSYWMPLASLLAAAIPAMLGSTSWFFARIPFYLVVACLPPLTAALTYNLGSSRSLALVGGVLSAFPGFYLPFLATSDTFGLYMLFGGFFFLILSLKLPPFIRSLLLGILSGLMHLSRSDGLLWLVVSFFGILGSPSPGGKNGSKVLAGWALCLGGYFLIMGPWFIRNQVAFGSMLPPGTTTMLWLTSYDEIFSFPASQVTFARWWSSGLESILSTRTWAMGLNLATLVSVQGMIFLSPLVLVGMWKHRRERLLRLALLAWLLIFLSMTVLFPFAGARGGYFHSGASLQVLFWAMAMVGLEHLLTWFGKRRGWDLKKARPTFQAGLLGMAILLTIYIAFQRLPSWDREHQAYASVNDLLIAAGMPPGAVVIVSNPPGFHLVSGHPAISVPNGNPEVIAELGQRYQARYLILESGSTPESLLPLYDHPQAFPGLLYLGEVEGARAYAIQP